MFIPSPVLSGCRFVYSPQPRSRIVSMAWERSYFYPRQITQTSDPPPTPCPSPPWCPCCPTTVCLFTRPPSVQVPSGWKVREQPFKLGLSGVGRGAGFRLGLGLDSVSRGVLPCPLARAAVPSVERLLYGSDPAESDEAKTTHLQSSSHTERAVQVRSWASSTLLCC